MFLQVLVLPQMFLVVQWVHILLLGRLLPVIVLELHQRLLQNTPQLPVRQLLVLYALMCLLVLVLLLLVGYKEH